ncbi:pro-neuregulin-1, membrane-bound isoform [Trichomycterus rosablanca]|uniref:pro-neuregulin-1, membrane-bound isoform n=1 Tax=Trichomycterus rosablanca TaxID=2290929 RepID=UPI002F35E593
METAGVEDSSDKLCKPQDSASSVGPPSEAPPEACPGKTHEEAKLEEEKSEEVEEEVVEENREECRLLGCLGLAAASCCICVELDQVRNCVRSEKICILPILACLLSLALCTAGLKWVFVDKIFEYEPPTHLDPKPMGQGPFIIDADPTLGLPVSFSHPTSPPVLTLNTTTTKPKVFVEGESTSRPFAPASPKVTPTSKVTSHKSLSSNPSSNTTPESVRNSTQFQHGESNNIFTKTSATSTTPSAKTSSHVTRCSEEEKSYCVNGGECFTLNVTPNSIKRLCRCPNEFTGDRCQNYVMASFYKHHGIEFMEAEELYQKRVLTITGICIALLVVGIMCVVAYCKTKKQRQKLHDRLRQSIRNHNAMADIGNGPQHLQKHHTPPQTLQLVNYASKNPVPSEHVIEKERETSFTTCQNTTCTAATHTSSQCWSNSVVSDSRPVLGALSGQNSRNGTPSHRGRLNATGGAREVSAYVKNSKETTDSYKESPYSERYVSAPTHPSPVKLLSPATPSSPPSEMSTALPSLATSVPSMATSPSGGDERPLLYFTPPPLREKSEPSRARQLRNSAHCNHGLEEISPPTSLQHTPEDEQLTIQEGDCSMPNSAPQSPTAMHIFKRTKPEDKNTQEEQKASSEGSSESSSSESETEEERMAEDKPFLLQNPGALGMAVLGLELADSSRTNTALHISPQDDLQTRLTSVMANQDPIAV